MNPNCAYCDARPLEFHAPKCDRPTMLIQERAGEAAARKAAHPKSEPVSDPVTAPAHYRAGAVECIDAIRATLTPAEFRGYCKGNALKYVWRERLKGGDQDLRKADWYLKELTK
jgi:hypothetical protein